MNIIDESTNWSRHQFTWKLTNLKAKFSFFFSFLNQGRVVIPQFWTPNVPNFKPHWVQNPTMEYSQTAIGINFKLKRERESQDLIDNEDLNWINTTRYDPTFPELITEIVTRNNKKKKLKNQKSVNQKDLSFPCFQYAKTKTPIKSKQKNTPQNRFGDGDDNDKLTCGSCCPGQLGTCPKRRHQMQQGIWPWHQDLWRGSVGRIGPEGTHPVAVRLEGSACPWRWPCRASS